MDYMESLKYIAGAGIGVLLTLLALRFFRKDITKQLVQEAQAQKQEDIKRIIQDVEKSFGDLSGKALSNNSTEFLKLANQVLSKQTELGGKELENKKQLIDQTLEMIKQEMEKVEKLMSDLEKDRIQKFGEVSKHLETTAKATQELQRTTEELRNALKSPQERGLWGQKIAEDILRSVGFIEGIHYLKEKTQDTNSKRPDFTFLLPQNIKLNMDAKFPYNNYLKYFESQNILEKENYKKDFFKDVKKRIREVTTRDYINPEEKTLDYVLVFIPIEHIYSFIHENDNSILDEAMNNKVILCSPFTLYAILSVIRQAIDCFNLERTADNILSLLGEFNKNWQLYTKSFKSIGEKIEQLRKEYENFTTTRTRQLDKPLKQIEELRRQKGIEPASLIETEEEDLVSSS